MTSKATTIFEIATWYDTWNQTGLNNLVNKTVPLNYAIRYNLAFGQLSADPAGGYTIEMTGQFADAVKEQILAQAPGAVIYAGLGDAGIAGTVHDNKQNKNRSTKNIVAWLQANGYSGVSIDAEGDGMSSVAEFVAQLGPSFRAEGLGIAVSVPWPSTGPTGLYGNNAVQAFNNNVDAVELQDYSSVSTANSVPIWTSAGVKASILMGGTCTENSDVQTSLEDTHNWAQYALLNGIRGMFSWRLDNDHGTQGKKEDVDPTFTGAKTIYDAVTSQVGIIRPSFEKDIKPIFAKYVQSMKEVKVADDRGTRLLLLDDYQSVCSFATKIQRAIHGYDFLPATLSAPPQLRPGARPLPLPGGKPGEYVLPKDVPHPMPDNPLNWPAEMVRLPQVAIDTFDAWIAAGKPA
jgi:hypothetical protein